MQSRAARNAHKHAFFFSHERAFFKSVLVFHGDDFVVNFRVQNFWNKARADSLDFMRARLSFGKHRRSGRFHGDDFHVLDFLFEEFSDACQSAARAHARDEIIDFAIRVFKNFRTRAFQMRLGIRGIFELPGNESVRIALQKFLGFFDCAFHSLRAVREDDFRAIRLDELPPFHAHRFGHNDNHFVAASRSHRSKSDSCVAARRFDYRRARLESAGFFRVVNHRLCDSVFHASRDVEQFEFRQDARGKSEFFFDVSQFKKRRAPDELIRRSVNFCHCFLHKNKN